MFYKCKPKSYAMTPRHRRICSPLARGSRCAFSRKCLSDRTMRNFIVKGLGRCLQQEVARLCSYDAVSILHSKATDSLKNFTWEKLLDEVRESAPILVKFLQSCTKTRKPRRNQDAIIGVLVAIMCKHRQPMLSLFQQLVSPILYSGHASKRVCMRACIIPYSWKYWQELYLVIGSQIMFAGILADF